MERYSRTIETLPETALFKIYNDICMNMDSAKITASIVLSWPVRSLWHLGGLDHLVSLPFCPAGTELL